MPGERRYTTEVLPVSDNLELFAPPYTPEQFTEEEQFYLRPFFTNLDKPVYAIYQLPEEVIAALASRYSRSTDSLRRTFLKEYVEPIIHPEKQKDWPDLTKGEQRQIAATRRQFYQYVTFLNRHGGIDAVVNTQRARKFFATWLNEFGDDSIEEEGGIHLCIEGLSNIATNEIESKRIGLSVIEKSSRYVSFAAKRPDGHYQYVVPGEIRGTTLELEFREVADLLFDTYVSLLEPYLAYIKELYPKGDEETMASFMRSRSARRFDDIRDLLPFATQTNVGLYGNGRAYEDLINRLADHPIGELRYWGQQICRELEKVVPSFVRRPQGARGAQVQIYRSNVKSIREEMAQKLFAHEQSPIPVFDKEGWVQLVSHTPDAAVEILSAFLFSGQSGVSLAMVRDDVESLSYEQKSQLLARILAERKFGNPQAERPEVRFRKVPRAFENAHYLFAIWARGGDYRDLHRHRQDTEERQPLGVAWGYDLEQDVQESPFVNQIKYSLEQAEKLFKKLEAISPDVAQYAVPYAFIQQFYKNMSARQIYWMVELRTGPQGRPHYRQICQQIAQAVYDVDPLVFAGLMADFDDYFLARRESELRTERKQQT